MTAKIPPTRTLRERPDIDQLRRQAKELLAAFLSDEADAVAEVNARYRKAAPTTFALHDAQLVLARSYGFESWPKLKAAVDGVTAARLHEAVEKSDIEAARVLLARRPEIVDVGRGETRALHMAVLKRDIDMTRLLLAAGADTRGGIWPNRAATSPRIIAQERGYDEIFALIVAEEAKRGARGPEAPADVFQQLGHAMMTGGEQAVVAALNAHPDLSGIFPPDGMTLLHQAAGRGMHLVARWLLDHGAEVNRQSRATRWAQGRTPLDVAATGCNGEPFDLSAFEPMAALLVERGAALTPLSAAALGRLDYLAACPRESLQGQFLLEAAVRCNRPDVLRHLLDMGLDPDERTQIGHSEDQTFTAGGPLMEAVNAGRIEMARVLLEHGADPNAPVFTSGSPTYAAYHGGSPRRHVPDPAMIELMVKHGGWIDAASVGYLREVEIARRMLAGELDPHLEFGTFSGQTVAEQILWSGASGRSPAIVRMALERIDWPPDDRRWFWMLWRPLPGYEDLNDTEQADCRESFRLILERCDPNLRAAESGQTMLHEVIARDHGVGVALASILLDAGARVDIRDNLLKSTPLGWACRWGRVSLVKLLLQRGADQAEPDAEPWAAPRAWAEKMGHGAVLAVLREHGH